MLYTLGRKNEIETNNDTFNWLNSLNEFNNDEMLYIGRRMEEMCCWWKFCFGISVNCPGMRQNPFLLFPIFYGVLRREREINSARRNRKIVSNKIERMMHKITTKCSSWLPNYSIEFVLVSVFAFLIFVQQTWLSWVLNKLWKKDWSEIRPILWESWTAIHWTWSHHTESLESFLFFLEVNEGWSMGFKLKPAKFCCHSWIGKKNDCIVYIVFIHTRM